MKTFEATLRRIEFVNSVDNIDSGATRFDAETENEAMRRASQWMREFVDDATPLTEWQRIGMDYRSGLERLFDDGGDAVVILTLWTVR